MDSRPKRKAALRSASKLSTKVPSAAHYVGYVDDDETPEMIMKKFAILEKYEQTLKKPTDQPAALPATAGSPVDGNLVGSDSETSATSASSLPVPAEAAVSSTNSSEALATTTTTTTSTNDEMDVVPTERPGGKKRKSPTKSARGAPHSPKRRKKSHHSESAEPIVVKPGEDGTFDQRTLERLFRETSYFNISQLTLDESLLDDEHERKRKDEENEFQLLSSDEDEDDDEDELSDVDSDDEKGFFNLEDEMDDEPVLDISQPEKPVKPRRAKRRVPPTVSKKVATRDPSNFAGKNKMKTVSMEVTGDDGYIYTIKKKLRNLDPLEPLYIRVPSYPMPLTWARNVKPFSLPLVEDPPGSQYFETDVLSFDLESLNRNFVGVILDVPWRLSNRDGPGYVSAADLTRLNLDRVCKAGLIFIWVEKETTADAVKLLHRWGFEYVENLNWVKHFVNHTVVTEPYVAGFAKSKQILLIFRKGEGFHMRHQRNPDVIFDFVKKDKYLTEDKPSVIFDIIETLLPDGAYRSQEEPGRWLELWGKKGVKRPGWSCIVQQEVSEPPTQPPPPLQGL